MTTNLDRRLGGADEPGVVVAVGAGDDEQVGARVGLERTELLVPPQDRGGMSRDHVDEITITDGHAGMEHVDDDARRFQFAEQVLAARRRPVGTEGDDRVP